MHGTKSVYYFNRYFIDQGQLDTKYKLLIKTLINQDIKFHLLITNLGRNSQYNYIWNAGITERTLCELITGVTGFKYLFIILPTCLT